MDSKGANIDLLFRNGLKDLEVLPPVEAWGVILPAVRKKQRPVIFFRNAALIAVLLSISFLTYKWGHEITSTFQNPITVLGEESIQNPVDRVNPRTGRGALAVAVRPEINENKISAVQNDSTLIPADEKIIPVKSDFIAADNRLVMDRNFLLPGKVLPIPDYKLDTRTAAGYYNLDEFSFDVPRERIDRWSVMAMASPTYYLSPVTGSDDISKQINASEQSQISYSGGVGFAYKLSKRLSIQSGLYYSSIGQEVDGINSFAGFRPYDYTKGDHNFEVLTSNGLIYANNTDVFLLDRSGDRVLTRYTKDIFDPTKANLSPVSSSLYQNFSYLEMPMILRYKLIDRIVDFNVIGGLSYNLLVNNSVTTVLDGNKYQVGTTGLNSFMVSSSLGMGMEYNLSEKFSLNLEPTFRYYLNPFGMIPGVNAHNYSFGIFSGFSYKF